MKQQNNGSRAIGKRFSVSIGKVFLSLLIGLFYIMSPLNTNLRVTHANSSGVAFAGFNTEMYSSSAQDLSTIDALLSEGVISFTGPSGNAIQYIDLQEIAASVDLGHLVLSFSTLAYLMTESGFAADEASFHLIFTADESLENPLKTFSIDRSSEASGTFESLSGSVLIPEGTRFMFVEYSAIGYGTNSIQFKSTSLKIIDNEDPMVTAQYNASWTNAPVTVLVTALDSQSGIEGIYDADTGSKVTEGSVTSFIAVTNETRRYYAIDYSGRTSETFEVKITNIDTTAPTQAPDINPTLASWTSSPITISLSTVIAAAGQSPEKRQYRIDNGAWTDYTSSFILSTEGQHTISARIIDEAGNLSPVSSKLYQLDQSAPVITQLSVYADPKGGASVTFTAVDAYSGGVIRKYAAGIKDKTYFGSSGTLLTQNSFIVALGGTYTVYAADALGNAVLEILTIDTFPFIEAIADKTISEDSVTDISLIISDSETSFNDLVVETSSSNPSLLPAPTWSKSGSSLILTLRPLENQNGGPVTITVKVKDGSNNETTKSFTVMVNAINDAPLVRDDTYETLEDHSVTFNPLMNDSDPENDDLIIQSITAGSFGAFVIASNGKSVTYTPQTNRHGVESVTVTVFDGTTTSQSTLTLTVIPQNDAPKANNDSYIINEDTVSSLDVLLNDTDVDLGNTLSESLSLISVSVPSHGSVSIVGNVLVYTPLLNWSGKEVFTYTMADSDGIPSTASVTVYVRTVNDAPLIQDLSESLNILEDSLTTTIHFSISDVETSVSSLMVQIASLNENLIPSNQIVLQGVGTSDGNIGLSFEVVPQKSGTARISVKVSDGFSVTTQIVTVTIAPVNDAPTANPDQIKYVEDQQLIIDPAFLLLNDTDIDLDALSFVRFLPLETGGSLVELPGQDLWVFTPDSNTTQDVAATYEITDGTVVVTGTLLLKAVSQNDLPIISADPDNPSSINEDAVDAVFTFEIKDFETPSSLLGITISSDKPELISSSSIRTELSGNNLKVMVSPTLNQFGTVHLTLTVSDGSGYTSSILTIFVLPVNDAPLAIDDAVYTDAGVTRRIDVLANDSDYENDALFVSTVSTATHGTVDLIDGEIFYTADPKYRGLDEFTVTVSDGFLTSTSTVTLSVGGFFFAPTISLIKDVNLFEDTISNEILFRVTDRDQDPFTISVRSQASPLITNDDEHLTLVDKGNGYYGLTITPNPDMSGSTLIEISVDDGTNVSTRSFKVTVYPVEDTPIANDDHYVTSEDTGIYLSPLSNDIDPDTLDQMLELVSLTQPSHGTVKNINGVLRYTPDSDYYGTDSLTYTATDGLSVVSATVYFVVSPVNDVPYTYGWTLELPNEALRSFTINPLSGVYDADVDPLTVEISGDPLYGSVVLNASNQLVYTRTHVSPLANGLDTFYVTYTDPSGASVVRTFTIGVDFPATYWAGNVYRTINEDSDGLSIQLPVSNPDSNPLYFRVSTPSKGQFLAFDSSNGLLTYQPYANENGTEQFTFTVKDLITLVEITRTVTIEILAINDDPVITADQEALTWAEDGMSDVLHVSMSDADGDALTYRLSILNSDKLVVMNSGIVSTLTDAGLDIQLSSIHDVFGSATLRISVSDGISSSTLEIPLTVLSVNDAPVARDLDEILKEDESLILDLMNALSDVENDPLVLTIDQQPLHGTLLIDNDHVTYTPYPDYYGTDTFTYHLNDGQADSDLATVNLQIDPKNDAPVISHLQPQIVMNEDSTLTITFTVSDPDQDPLELTLSNYVSDLFDAQDITVQMENNKVSLTLKPQANQFGSIKLLVSLSDGILTVTRSVDVLVMPVNDAPITQDDDFAILEDTATDFDVLANDVDLENSPLSIIAISASLNGAEFSVNPDGTLHYVPAKDWFGTDALTLTIADAQGGQSVSILTIHVDAVNDAPIATDDARSIDEDITTQIDVLLNDTDPENDALTVTIITQPLHGQVSINPDKTLTYVPDLNYYGNDEFIYQISDGNLTDEATVRIAIASQNDVPVVTNMVAENGGVWTMMEDTQGVFTFLLNDPETDVRNLILTLSSSDSSLIPDTSITYEGSGNEKTITMMPNENQYGTLLLTITASDGVNTSVFDITVQVLAVNDAPILADQQVTLDEDSAYDGSLLASDVDSNLLTYTLKSNATHGTVTLEEDGHYHYQPDLDFNGSDSFTVTIDDHSGSQTATTEVVVWITVLQVNDAPTALDLDASTEEDTPCDLTIDLSHDPDMDPVLNQSPEAEKLHIDPSGFGGTIHGTLSIQENIIRYTPESNYNGVVSFTYTIVDESGATAQGTITITVSSVNDAPSNGDDSVIVIEDTPKELVVLPNDDVDLITNPLTELLHIEAIASAPSHGSASITADGQRISYVPALNYFGPDSLTYTVQDAAGAQQTFTVSITVTPVNDAPMISSISNQIIDEDTPTSILNFVVTDVEDGGDLTVTAVSNATTLVPNNASYVVLPVTSGNNRTIKIIPSANRSGTVRITLTVRDKNNATTTTSFNVTVNAVNDEPNPVNDSAVTNENTDIVIDVLVNDDVDELLEGDDLRLISVEDADGISVAGNWATQIIYNSSTTRDTLKFIPDRNWTSKIAVTEVLRYTMRDAVGTQTYTGYVSITINPVNDAPTITFIPDQTFNEDDPDGFGLVQFQIDDEEDGNSVLTVQATSSVTSLIANEDLHIGVLTTSDQAERTIQAQSLPDQNGTTIITVKVTDTNGAYTSTGFTTIVAPVDDAPRNGNDAYVFDEDTPTILDVLANDDIDLDTNAALESVVIETIDLQPLHGTVTLSLDHKTILYTPDANYFGSDSFTYTMNSLAGLPGTFTVDLTIRPVNDAPVIVTDIPDKTVDEGQSSGPISFLLYDVDNALDDLTLIVNSTNKVLVPLANISVVNLPDGYRQITLMPNGKWNGTTTIEITAKDPVGALSLKESFKFIVNSINEAPTANADLNNVINEDGTILINVLGNDTDPDIASNAPGVEVLSVISVSTPAHGSAVLVGNSIRYTPIANYNGYDTFTYTISDLAGLTSSASVRVKINGRNDAPTTTNDAAQTDEDHSIVLDLLANDWDIDADLMLNTDSYLDPASEILSLDPAGFSGVTHGSVWINAEGKAVFEPESDFNGEVSFTYTVIDPSGAKTTGTVTVTINAVNDQPYAQNDAATIFEDSSLELDLSLNDGDVDMDPLKNLVVQDALSYALLETPLHGTATLNGSILSYHPAENDNRTVTLTYQVRDPFGETHTATVTITITPVNDAPIAVEDTAITNEDQDVVIDVTQNDTDIDQDPILNVWPNDQFRVTAVTSPLHGTVSILNDHELLYIPLANYNGQDTFTYTITDDAGLSSTVSVEITVLPINDAPHAFDDVKSGNEDSIISVNVLTNDTDIDQNVLLNLYPRSPETLTLISISGVTNGSAEFTAAGLIAFTPTPNFNGSVTFSYTIKDSEGVESTAFVTFTVNAVNDAPIANADSAITNEDTVILIDVLANDTDVDLSSDLNHPLNELLSLVSVSSVTHGSAVIVSGKVRFTPSANYNGMASLTYTVKDKAGIQRSATVTISIQAAEDNPVAIADSATTSEDQGLLIDVLANDSDVDQSLTLNQDPMASVLTQTLSVTALGIVTHGTAYIEDNKVHFIPQANYNGSVSFTVTISDNTGRSATALLTISVTAVNDVPTAVNDFSTMDEDSTKDFDVLANDGDVDLDSTLNTLDPQSLSIRVISVDHGSAIVVNNKIRVTPIANFNKTITVTYEVYDQHNASAQASLSIDVNPINDGPQAFDDTVSVDEDGVLSFDPRNNDQDIDLDAILNAYPQLESLSILSCGTAMHGTVLCSADSITYTPFPDHNGQDSFTVTITDQSGSTSTSTVFVTIRPQNDSPVAHNDFASMDEDGTIDLDLLANDTDIDLDQVLNAEDLEVLRIVDGSWIGVLHGTVSVVGSRLHYVPDANFNGIETFTVDIEDLSGATSSASVTITVNAVNDAPLAYDDALHGSEDMNYQVDVLSNDFDIDFDETLNFMEQETWSIQIVSADPRLNASVCDQMICLDPIANLNGRFVVTYRVTDRNGASDEADLEIVLDAVNDDPSATTDEITTDEDQSVLIDVLANDTDVDLDPTLNLFDITEHLRITEVTQGHLGTVIISGNKLVYTPNANVNGMDEFTYTITDEDNRTVIATVYVLVNPINDAPVAVSDEAITSEDKPIDVDVLGNDTDVDALASLNESPNDLMLTLISVGQVDHATVTLVNNQLHIVPLDDYNGVLTIPYTMADESGVQSSSVLTLTILAVNDAPVAIDDDVTVEEDHTILIDVLANDTDVDGDVLLNVNPFDEQLSIVTPLFDSEKGTLILVDQKILFKPNDNVNGDLVLLYTITDASGATASAYITVHVTQANDAPVAADDEFTTDEDTPILIDVLYNDQDVDADCAINVFCDETGLILSPEDLPIVENAVLTIEDHKIRVTPRQDFNGDLRFTYLTHDAQGAYASANVVIHVTSVNDAPLANDDHYTIDEDQSSLFDVLLNDQDVDLDAVLNMDPTLERIRIEALGFYQVQHGLVSLEGTMIRFVPEPDFNGEASFDYTIVDKAGLTSTAHVTITILKAADAPVAYDDEAIVDEDRSVIVDVLANDQDIDFDPLLNLDPDQIALKLLEAGLGNPSHGVITIENQQLKYTPEANYNGMDEVTYTVVDADGNLDQAILRITVLPINDAPEASDDVFETDEDQALLLDVMHNDRDIDFDEVLNLSGVHETMTILEILEPVMGARLNIEEGKIKFVPQKDYNGPVEFDYVIVDEAGSSAMAHVVVMVHAVNDAPIANEDRYTIDEESTLRFDPLANDVDIDADPLLNLEKLSELPSIFGDLSCDDLHGTLSFADGQYEYVPDQDFNGSIHLSYQITDAQGVLSTAVITITVNPVNDPVLAVNDELSLREDQGASLNLIENDLDVDLDREGDHLTLLAINQPKNGTIKILDDGQSIRYIPKPNYHGIEEVFYTVSDQEGLTSIGKVRIVVSAVNDAPIGLIVVSPSQGEAYKDGQSVHVSWTQAEDIDHDLLTYTLEFFNGSEWETLAEDLSALSFDHTLRSGVKETTEAHYRVTASDGRIEITAISESFIIDNNAPQNIKLTLTCKDGTLLTNGKCADGLTIETSEGIDLLDFVIEYRVEGDPQWKALTSDGIQIDRYGKFLVEIKATDILGNTQTLTTIVIIENRSPLANPLNWMLLGALALLLLILFGRRQIIIVYEGKDPQGKAFRVVKKKFAKRPVHDEPFDLILPIAPANTLSIQVIYTTSFTRRMRERQTVVFHKDKQLGSFTIPSDDHSRYTQLFRID